VGFAQELVFQRIQSENQHPETQRSEAATKREVKTQSNHTFAAALSKINSSEGQYSPQPRPSTTEVTKEHEGKPGMLENH